MINDLSETVPGTLELLTTSPSGEVLSRSEVRKVMLDGLGQQELALELDIPDTQEFVLYARLRYGDELLRGMVDRRKHGFPHHGVRVVDLSDL